VVDELSGRVPFNRWGRLVGVPEHEHCFVFVERESPERWKVPPPEDAIRVWHRRPGPDEYNDHNYSAWHHATDAVLWPTEWQIDWLSERTEPDWG
jgi:hypothetical protein